MKFLHGVFDMYSPGAVYFIKFFDENVSEEFQI